MNRRELLTTALSMTAAAPMLPALKLQTRTDAIPLHRAKRDPATGRRDMVWGGQMELDDIPILWRTTYVALRIYGSETDYLEYFTKDRECPTFALTHGEHTVRVSLRSAIRAHREYDADGWPPMVPFSTRFVSQGETAREIHLADAGIERLLDIHQFLSTNRFYPKDYLKMDELLTATLAIAIMRANTTLNPNYHWPLQTFEALREFSRETSGGYWKCSTFWSNNGHDLGEML